MPQAIFVVLICAITIIAILDYEEVVAYFHILVDWVKMRPELAQISIVAVYSLLIILTLPVIYLTIGLGFALSKVYVDFPEKSFLVGFPFIWIGMVLGAVISFVFGRYLFGRLIKQRCYQRHH